MTDDATIDRTGATAGVALVHGAQVSGDWKTVVDWIAAYPQFAGEVAQFIADDRQLSAAFPAPPAVIRSGSQYDGIELREILGIGAMGVVYRGHDPVLRRDVAVKVVRTDHALSEVELERFRLEAERVASLSHANIVPVLTTGSADGIPYMVMPLMTGGSLAAWLKAFDSFRRPDEMKAAHLLRDIALGVDHAHKQGLIHRDLKPANILLDDDGSPRIADFGIARSIDATASTNAGIAGTVPYMAPEQARAERGLTTSVDIHALGAILFELLTGRTPFAGGDVASILRRVVEEPAPLVRTFRAKVSRGLEAICLKCLEKDPAKRYAFARDLASDLDLFLKGDLPKAQQPGFWDWLRQLSRIAPDPTPNKLWPTPALFGTVVLLANAMIYFLAQYGGNAAHVWIVNLSCGAILTALIWWFALRRFREISVIDRHSLIIAAGKVIVYVTITAAYVPFSFDVPAGVALGIYPAMFTASGLVFFVLGSTNWSRFFPIGTAVMALAPVAVQWPGVAPLVYGGTLASILWYWAYVKGPGNRVRAME